MNLRKHFFKFILPFYLTEEHRIFQAKKNSDYELGYSLFNHSKVYHLNFV